MADDPTTEPVDEPATGDPDDLGDPGKRALDNERKARREAERQLREMQARVKEIEDKDKSETDKLREQVASLTEQAQKHEAKALRAEVAMSKGLTAAQAKRLVGSTVEELEADADEILEAFPARPSGAPTEKPRTDLRGGSDPTEEPDVDIRKVVDAIPRGF